MFGNENCATALLPRINMKLQVSFDSFHKLIWNQFGGNIQIFRSDSGRELVNPNDKIMELYIRAPVSISPQQHKM